MTLLSKKILANLFSIFVFSILFIPAITFADNPYTPLITCDGSVAKPCDFAAFIGTINRIINWIISMAGVVFTISFIYGGWLWILSGDNPGKKGEAKKVLWSTVTGFVIILTSWLIVFTILNILVPKDAAHDSIFQFIGGR